MTIEPRLEIIGAALADTSRSRILCELMDGRAFTNKELSCAARITPQTTSVHLKHLESAGLTKSMRSGRHVYHQIAGEEVAEALEGLARLSPIDHLARSINRNLPEENVLTARSCYNMGITMVSLLRRQQVHSNSGLWAVDEILRQPTL